MELRMGSWTPSIVPNGDDQNVYLVVNDFGRHGTAWCETDVEETDLENVITDLLDGQYNSPARVVGFNVAERWARDVSEDVAEEIQRRCDLQLTDVPDFLQDFIDRHASRDPRQLTLRLV
jgi:hypothetical protein